MMVASAFLLLFLTTMAQDEVVSLAPGESVPMSQFLAFRRILSIPSAAHLRPMVALPPPRFQRNIWNNGSDNSGTGKSMVYNGSGWN